MLGSYPPALGVALAYHAGMARKPGNGPDAKRVLRRFGRSDPTPSDEIPDFGGIDLGVIQITDTFDRSPIIFDKLVEHPKNVHGTLRLSRGDITETIEINDAWFAREYRRN